MTLTDGTYRFTSSLGYLESRAFNAAEWPEVSNVKDLGENWAEAWEAAKVAAWEVCADLGRTPLPGRGHDRELVEWNLRHIQGWPGIDTLNEAKRVHMTMVASAALASFRDDILNYADESGEVQDV